MQTPKTSCFFFATRLICRDVTNQSINSILFIKFKSGFSSSKGGVYNQLRTVENIQNCSAQVLSNIDLFLDLQYCHHVRCIFIPLAAALCDIVLLFYSYIIE